MTTTDIKAAHRRLKGMLTRAINSGNPAKVEAACLAAADAWRGWPYGAPDDWHRWNIAALDATGLDLDGLERRRADRIAAMEATTNV